MPARPRPTTYKCPACAWSKTVAPRSDALGPGDYFHTCPQCQHTSLTQQRANPVQAAWVEWTQCIDRMRR